ncbi:D-alanyl-D-alanine carboxypeptidase/D-alanyl-D-alanine-endopeptidase [Glycomyces tarimensis]
MRKRTIITGAVAIGAATALGIAGTVVAQAQETGGEALGEAIDRILTDGRLTDSQVGVVVADAATGEVLYDRNGNQRALPASSQKLTTVAAALETLGGDFAFTTEAVGTEPPVDGVIDGDLYLRGSGDPTMRAQEYDKIAADLVDAGVTTVDGDLIADDTAFDDERHGTEWAWGDLQYAYAAEISALTVTSGDDLLAGSVRVFVDPGNAEGDAAEIETVPATDYVTIVNDATTTAPGTGTSVAIDRDEHANEIRVTGTIAADSGGTYGTRAVIDPAGLAASVFQAALADHGITLTGETRTGETTPQDGQTLATHDSKPLSELAEDLMKPSNNLLAESLFKALGYQATGEGTFDSGKAAVYKAIEQYGVDTGPIRQVDGSGLSRFDELTPNMITDLLIGAKDADWFEDYYDSLPIACGDDGSTLVGRMCGTPAADNVRAKTGSLTSVSALSGYVTDADGRELVFSIMFNDHLAGSVKDIEDKIAAAIAGHSESATESAITTFSNLEDIEQPASDLPGDLECTWVEPAVC